MLDTKKLDRLMNQKQISILNLSQKTNLNYSALHAAIRGKTKSINSDSLLKICKALECTPNDLLKY